jgi:hypothetical protein
MSFNLFVKRGNPAAQSFSIALNLLHVLVGELVGNRVRFLLTHNILVLKIVHRSFFQKCFKAASTSPSRRGCDLVPALSVTDVNAWYRRIQYAPNSALREHNPTDPAMTEADAEFSRVEVQANKRRKIDKFPDS